MQAKDLMTAEIVVVAPDTPVDEIARVLLDHGISAAPVVDASGAPVGMVSEGDLIGRNERDRDARRDWWLALLAEGEALHPDFISSLRSHHETAADVMTAPVITTGESAEAPEIARLLAIYRIKRLPVVRDRRIVGIVSRADLLRALAAEPDSKPPKPAGLLATAVDRIDRGFHLHGRAAAAGDRPGPAMARADERLNAADLRALVADFKHDRSRRHEEEHRAATERRKRRVRELIDNHVDDAMWHGLLHDARQAAERGEEELLLLRFPSQLCTDGGRAINTRDPDWPKTLRGEAAEIYLRWEHDLKPHGFHLSAQILEFPGGMPGDVGLFLVWGNEELGA